MAKRNKIPKNRPISEMMGKKAKKIEPEETITMEAVIAAMDKKQQEREERKKQERASKKQERKSFGEKIQNMAMRKDNQFAEDKRKEKYLEAVSKVEEKQKGQEER